LAADEEQIPDSDTAWTDRPRPPANTPRMVPPHKVLAADDRPDRHMGRRQK
jgi:hypothetical protein